MAILTHACPTCHKPAKILKLTNDINDAIVHEEDYEKLANFNWSSNGKGIHTRMGENITYLGRYIIGPSKLRYVDHKDRNIYNNCKCNLRNCTASQNGANQGISKSNTSGYKGINWDSRCQKWRVRIKVNYIEIHLGRYHSIQEAVEVYNEAALKYFGKFAFQNEIPK